MTDKTFEELLAELDVEEEKDSEREPEPKGNQVLKQVRDAAKRYEKENKTLRERLEKFEEEKRTSVLAAAGLTERQTEVFLRANYEATPENIASFKKDVLGVPDEHLVSLVTTDSELLQGAAPNAQSFAPSAGGEPPGSKVYTQKEFEDIMRENPAVGRALWEAGKVKFNNPQP